MSPFLKESDLDMNLDLEGSHLIAATKCPRLGKDFVQPSV